MGHGKFDGVLLVTDYDDTLYDLNQTIPERNRRAIRYFVGQGGRFSIATGRAYDTFTPQITRESLPINAPVVLSNGSSIYDYARGCYLERTALPDSAPSDFSELIREIPEMGFEAYQGDEIYVYQPNRVTRMHMERVGKSYTECPVADMPAPWTKAILEQDWPVLRRAQQWLLDRYSDRYEVIFSNHYLLEVTAKGATKGRMVEKIAEYLGIVPGHIYCVGDNQNDISMLSVSAIPFAPANCAPEVRQSGARLLCHCNDGAVGEAIEIIDSIY